VTIHEQKNPQKDIDIMLEVGKMKSVDYIKKEERIIESLLEMLDHSVWRMAQTKDVPPYLLKEIIELLQIYGNVSHTARKELIRSLIGDSAGNEYEGGHAVLRKYERFLLEVIEAYDLGYQGARGVFSHYAGQYISVFRGHRKYENDVLHRWIVGHDRHDNQLLRELKRIDGGAKKTRERGLVRIQMLWRDMRKVAA